MANRWWKKRNDEPGGDRSSRRNADYTASQAGAFASRHTAAATDEAMRGMGALRGMAERLTKVDSAKKQGNLFEIIEATKFNMDAASKGIDNVRASVTALEGSPHSAADIVIRKNGRIVREVQAKSSGKASDATMMFRDGKYTGMQKLTNPEHADKVRSLAEQRADTNGLYSDLHRDTADNVRGGLELESDGIRSKGTSHAEATRAADQPTRYANRFELVQAGKEALVTGGKAAAAGGIIGGAVSLAKNAAAVRRGEKTGKEAALDTAKDAVKSGAKSGLVGMLGVGIRTGAAKIGLKAVAKSNVATAIAAGVVDSGVSIYRYARGEISGQEAVERIGETGVSTTSSILAGAAAGAAFGPVGALVGSIAGYLVASSAYQSCIAILQDARLSEIEAARLIALCEEAVAEMRAQREAFESMIAAQLSFNREQFTVCFRRMDEGPAADDFAGTVLALERFAGVFGKQLKLAKFGEFDAHMRTHNRLDL